MSGWVGGCKARSRERQVRHQGSKIFRVMQVQFMTERKCLLKCCTLVLTWVGWRVSRWVSRYMDE